ncbi:hypothetical protein K440DRAFT_621455 [Wilcoxina mikolae CBS 423.85]|nr:hypothetical protein K440DRAFT_621455 [Wilcoxina mikolae CBS 423.85]
MPKYSDAPSYDSNDDDGPIFEDLEIYRPGGYHPVAIGDELDLHTGNTVFALTVNIQTSSVEEVYEALGGEPVKVSLHKAIESMNGRRPLESVSSHQPKYLVCPPWFHVSESCAIPLHRAFAWSTLTSPSMYRTPSILCGNGCLALPAMSPR